MVMRIGIAGLSHETNVYATARTGRTTLDRFRVKRGAEILDRYRDTRTTIGGAIAEATDAGALLVPLIAAEASPSGILAGGTYRELKTRILSAILEAGPLDGLFLDLHGAGVAEGAEDLEADLTAAVRAIARDSTIVTAFDLHANVGPATLANLDAAFVYESYPHLDSFERGAEAVRTLVETRRGTIRPAMRVEVLPMQLPPLAGWTDSDPMRAANLELRTIEGLERVLDCTIAHGFPYAPGPVTRTAVVAIADGDPAVAQRAARRGAEWIWEQRSRFAYRGYPAAEAIAMARTMLAALGGPIVLHEANDNPGAGSAAEGTHLLRSLLEADGMRVAIGPICDASAAAAAHRSGLDATLAVSIGAHRDRTGLSGRPVDCDAIVVGLSDGRFRLRAMGAGLEADLGPMAALQVGSVVVVVSSEPSQALDPGYFETVGVDVNQFDIVAVKSIHHFKAGFGPVMTAAVPVDGPGLSQVDVTQLGDGWHGTWPWDPSATFDRS